MARWFQFVAEDKASRELAQAARRLAGGGDSLGESGRVGDSLGESVNLAAAYLRWKLAGGDTSEGGCD